MDATFDSAGSIPGEGAKITGHVTPPQTNVDGTPITNLKSISMWYRLDSRETEAVILEVAPDEKQTQDWTFEAAVLEGQSKTLALWGTAKALNGAVSAKSAEISLIVDRTNTIPNPPS